jgi:hypothetical protein
MAGKMGEYEETVMAKLSYVEWGQHAHNAGFRGNDIVIAVSVGYAESSPPGEANSVGDGGNSYGFMQIHWPSWGVRLRQNGIASTPEALKQPAIVMRAAKYVKDHGSRGWGEWTQYRNGSYKRYESDVQKAILEKSDQEITETQDLVPDLGGVAQAIGQVGASLKAIWNLGADAGKWIGNPDNWIRIAQVTAGGAVLVVGAGMILKETDAGKAALSAATKGAVK